MFWRRLFLLFVLGLSTTAALANGWVRDERELVPEYAYCRDCIQWMDADLLGRHFAQIVRENATREFTDLGDPNQTPRLFSYLMGSPRVQHRSYLEPALENWVREQPNNAIDPPAIFRQALSLAGGDVHGALLTIFELLKNNARFFNEVLVAWPSTYEMRREFFDHFIDLRGDLKERGGKFRGDHAGGWYRMFGMLLYSYHRAISSMSREDRLRPIDSGPLMGRWRLPQVRLTVTAVAAEVLKPLLNWKDPDRMKVLSNIRGVRIARSFLQSLSDPSRLKNIPDEKSRRWLADGGKNHSFCARALRWATEF